MATSNGDLNVSSGARSALRRARGVLEGYGAEDPRIASLMEKMSAIESPEDGFDRAGAELAKRYQRAEELKKNESPAVREAGEALSWEVQMRHLQNQSPRGYAFARDAAVKAGRISD